MGRQRTEGSTPALPFTAPIAPAQLYCRLELSIYCGSTVGLLWVYCGVLLPYHRASVDEHPTSRIDRRRNKGEDMEPKYEEMAR